MTGSRVAVVVIFAGVLAASPALAAEDEVLKHIGEATGNYKAGKHQEAINSLNFAVGLIREKQGGALAEALPPAMDGWKCEDTGEGNAAMAMMGGGSMVQRNCSKGRERVSFMLMTNSPMLQGYAMMLTNPAMLAGKPGTKLVTVKGQKAVEEWEADGKSGKYTIVLMNTMLITAEGKQLAEQDTLRKYVEGIDFDKLKKFLMSQ